MGSLIKEALDAANEAKDVLAFAGSRVVMLLSLSGRLTPNLVGVLALKPDAIECIVSKDTPARCIEI